MKSKLRSDKTLDWLAQSSRIRTVAPTETETKSEAAESK
jgi:hypothetical protein